MIVCEGRKVAVKLRFDGADIVDVNETNVDNEGGSEIHDRGEGADQRDRRVVSDLILSNLYAVCATGCGPTAYTLPMALRVSSARRHLVSR